MSLLLQVPGIGTLNTVFSRTQNHAPFSFNQVALNQFYLQDSLSLCQTAVGSQERPTAVFQCYT